MGLTCRAHIDLLFEDDAVPDYILRSELALRKELDHMEKKVKRFTLTPDFILSNAPVYITFGFTRDTPPKFFSGYSWDADEDDKYTHSDLESSYDNYNSLTTYGRAAMNDVPADDAFAEEKWKVTPPFPIGPVIAFWDALETVGREKVDLAIAGCHQHLDDMPSDKSKWHVIFSNWEGNYKKMPSTASDPEREKETAAIRQAHIASPDVKRAMGIRPTYQKTGPSLQDRQKAFTSEAKRPWTVEFEQFWLDPNGKIHEVNEPHNTFAMRQLGAVSDDPDDDDEPATYTLIRQGWQRGVCSVDQVLVNGGELNRAQRAALERVGIEHDLTITYHSRYSSRDETVYTPPKTIREQIDSMFEAMENELNYLKQELTMSDEGKAEEAARLMSYELDDWLDSNRDDYPELENFKVDDESHWESVEELEKASPDAFKAFGEWAYEKIGNYDHGSDAPPWVSMTYRRTVRDEWLVHFSDDAYSIHSDGFKYGVNPYETDRLALSTHFNNRKKGPGFNFAYLANDATRYGRGGGGYARNDWKYGSGVVMFQATGVLVDHHGDQEPQVIYLGKTAHNIVYLRQVDEGWGVGERPSGNPVFKSEKLDDVIDWVINNYAQYRKPLRANRENPTKKTRY